MALLHTFDEILDIVNSEIDNITYQTYHPGSLFEPITYILSLGGKRVRPALALMACNLYGDDVSRAMPVALGIEIFHNFTLLHDDLMDRADMRRGKPTVHVKWNDNVAVLSGDAMLIESYKEIAKVDTQYLPQILTSFSQVATEICCGQQLDMEFENRMDVTAEEYIEMIRLKTAVLLGCAMHDGALVGGAPKSDTDALYEFGINVGLAFQIKDDLLDVYGDSQSFGKKIGGDILCNKKTFLLISALANKEAESELKPWLKTKCCVEDEKIAAVRSVYDRLGLKQKSEELLKYYYDKAVKNLEQVKVSEDRKSELYDLAESLMFRNT